MSSVHRVVDYPTFADSINKSKRNKLVSFVRETAKYQADIPVRTVQVMALSGWSEYEKPAKEKRRDSGEIRALVKFRDGVVFFVIDNLGNGGEEFRHVCLDEEAVRFIVKAAERQTSAPTIKKKDGTPFAGFNGGRKKKELTDEEKERILALRKAGNNVNVIARELHISNRIVSEFVKKN